MLDYRDKPGNDGRKDKPEDDGKKRDYRDKPGNDVLKRVSENVFLFFVDDFKGIFQRQIGIALLGRDGIVCFAAFQIEPVTADS